MLPMLGISYSQNYTLFAQVHQTFFHSEIQMEILGSISEVRKSPPPFIHIHFQTQAGH